MMSIKKECIKLVITQNCIKMHGQQNIKTVCTPEHSFHSKLQDAQYCSNDGQIQYAFNISTYVQMASNNNSADSNRIEADDQLATCSER
jgi:hypothetical protein